MAQQPQVIAVNAADSKVIQQAALKHLNSQGIKANANLGDIAEVNGYALVGWIQGVRASNTSGKRHAPNWRKQ